MSNTDMSNIDTSLLDRAVVFAVKAHSGAERRGKGTPYIIHPMEAVSIVATMTRDQELLAAAALHDTIEDTGTTEAELREAFGERVASLVASESDTVIEGMSSGESWHMRKQAAIERLAAAPVEVKMVALGDKLSNMRAIAQDYASMGDALWQRFHVKEKREHEWHYRGLAASLSQLRGMAAYDEFTTLIERVFGGSGALSGDTPCRTPVTISLSDYAKSGEGAVGESFDHRTDPGIMLKLYEGDKYLFALNELELSRKVYDAGIPCPEPGDFVTDGRRYGIRFKRIAGKISYARAVSRNPESIAAYAAEFARMCRELHATEVDREVFGSIKINLSRGLIANRFFTTAEKDRLLRFINDAPETSTAIHGDLHFGNAIFTETERYFIDLGDFTSGYSMFDTGMVYLTCNLNEEGFTKSAFHMDNPTARRFWEAFAPEYFGKDRPLASIEEEIRPYAGLRTIIIEEVAGKVFPEFREALRPVLK